MKLIDTVWHVIVQISTEFKLESVNMRMSSIYLFSEAMILEDDLTRYMERKTWNVL